MDARPTNIRITSSLRPTVPTSPRKLPKQARSRATVEALLAATARVLAREGYEKATTNRIAEVSGYGIGSLYEYFPNKESLVATLIGRHAEEMLTLFDAWSEEHADSPLPVAVKALVETSIKAHTVEPELHKVLVEQVPRVGDLARIGRIEDRITNLVRGYLERRTAEIVPEDPDLTTFVVARTVEALGHEAVLAKRGYLNDDRLVKEVTALILRHLASDG